MAAGQTLAPLFWNVTLTACVCPTLIVAGVLSESQVTSHSTADSHSSRHGALAVCDKGPLAVVVSQRRTKRPALAGIPTAMFTTRVCPGKRSPP